MAANTNIKVSTLNFDEIKDNLKNYLKAKPEFLDYNFDGSIINTLLDILAYNTYQNAYYTSMVGNEMFLDSALLRPNIVSRAKMLGYTPRSARGAQTEATITLSGVSSCSLFITPFFFSSFLSEGATCWLSAINLLKHNTTLAVN